MTRPALGHTEGDVIRHFGRAVGENWRMQPVSDGASGRARAESGDRGQRP